jgi:hypothetical protein
VALPLEGGASGLGTVGTEESRGGDWMNRTDRNIFPT